MVYMAGLFVGAIAFGAIGDTYEHFNDHLHCFRMEDKYIKFINYNTFLYFARTDFNAAELKST